MKSIGVRFSNEFQELDYISGYQGPILLTLHNLDLSMDQ